jgi:hypothetical protein
MYFLVSSRGIGEWIVLAIIAILLSNIVMLAIALLYNESRFYCRAVYEEIKCLKLIEKLK